MLPLLLPGKGFRCWRQLLFERLPHGLKRFLDAFMLVAQLEAAVEGGGKRSGQDQVNH